MEMIILNADKNFGGGIRVSSRLPLVSLVAQSFYRFFRISRGFLCQKTKFLHSFSRNPSISLKIHLRRAVGICVHDNECTTDNVKDGTKTKKKHALILMAESVCRICMQVGNHSCAHICGRVQVDVHVRLHQTLCILKRTKTRRKMIVVCEEKKREEMEGSIEYH